MKNWNKSDEVLAEVTDVFTPNHPSATIGKGVHNNLGYFKATLISKLPLKIFEELQATAHTSISNSVHIDPDDAMQGRYF